MGASIRRLRMQICVDAVYPAADAECADTDLETITESKVSLQIASVEAATDVLLQYRLQNGQAFRMCNVNIYGMGQL
eukprot:1139077-Pelagomonas_calceolata.AAC.4